MSRFTFSCATSALDCVMRSRRSRIPLTAPEMSRDTATLSSTARQDKYTSLSSTSWYDAAPERTGSSGNMRSNSRWRVRVSDMNRSVPPRMCWLEMTGPGALVGSPDPWCVSRLALMV